ncbi:hypothetical protein ACLBWT_18790 [Paenibacillus sp. D51F]
MITREKYQLRVMTCQELVLETEKENFDLDEAGWLFGIDFSREDWTLAKFVERPSIFKFDDPVQRGTDAWDDRKRSEGIASILMNIELGPIKAQKKNLNKTLYRNVIDGGNRLNSQRDFIKNMYALKEGTYIFGQQQDERILIDLSDCYFKDLPKIFQNRILGYAFQVHLYDMDDELKNEMFYRWNNYEAHTTSELKRPHMSAILQSSINNMLKMDFAKIGFKEEHIKRSLHMEPLLGALALMETGNKTNLKEETINELLYQNKFSPETIARANDAAAFLEEVFRHMEMDHKLRKKVFHKKNKATLVYVASLAIPFQPDPESFAKWAKQFFIEDADHTGYKQSGGDTREGNVQRRNEIAWEHYQQTIA